MATDIYGYRKISYIPYLNQFQFDIAYLLKTGNNCYY